MISNLQVGKVKATFAPEDRQQIAVEEDFGSLLGEFDLGPSIADFPDAIKRSGDVRNLEHRLECALSLRVPQAELGFTEVGNLVPVRSQEVPTAT